MEEELNKLNELSDFFRRMNAKVLLIKLMNKAKSEYDKCDYKSGRKTLEDALLIDTSNPAIYRGLGCIEQFDKNFDKATEYFNKALDLSESKEIEYTLLGMVYYLQDRLDEAVKYFNLAIDSNDNYTQAYEGRNQAMLENHLKIIDLQESLLKHFR